MRWFFWRGILTFIVIAAVMVAFGLWFVIFPTPRFPEPTGPHGIGTRLYYWTDAARPEPFTADSDDRRQLVVQVWYPSSTTAPRQSYIDHAETLAALAQRLHIPPLLLTNMQHAPTHAVRDGAVLPGAFPVLINPTGFSGFGAASLFWIEELVSHGYVVVTLDQPGTAAAAVLDNGRVIPVVDKAEFDRHMPLALSEAAGAPPPMNGMALPEGILPYLAADLSFVLDQLAGVEQSDPLLAGALDLAHVGVFGMSLGGYVGPEACYRDARFGACLAVDAGKSEAVARDGLEQPLMIISRDADIMREERSKAGGWPEAEIEQTITSQRALFAHNRGDAYYVTMNGMYHVNWTDAPIWSPLLGWIGLAGPIDPYRGFAVTNGCTLAFFERYLKGGTGPVACMRPGDEADIRVDVRLAGIGG